jgi:hypothetical protein
MTPRNTNRKFTEPVGGSCCFFRSFILCFHRLGGLEWISANFCQLFDRCYVRSNTFWFTFGMDVVLTLIDLPRTVDWNRLGMLRNAVSNLQPEFRWSILPVLCRRLICEPSEALPVVVHPEVHEQLYEWRGRWKLVASQAGQTRWICLFLRYEFGQAAHVL